MPPKTGFEEHRQFRVASGSQPGRAAALGLGQNRIALVNSRSEEEPTVTGAVQAV
jgi:hypothetical protein